MVQIFSGDIPSDVQALFEQYIIKAQTCWVQQQSRYCRRPGTPVQYNFWLKATVTLFVPLLDWVCSHVGSQQACGGKGLM